MMIRTKHGMIRKFFDGAHLGRCTGQAGDEKVGCCDNNPVGLWRGLDKQFHQNLASWPMGIVAILSKPVVMAFRDVDPLPNARLCRKTRLGICDTR